MNKYDKKFLNNLKLIDNEKLIRMYSEKQLYLEDEQNWIINELQNRGFTIEKIEKTISGEKTDEQMQLDIKKVAETPNDKKTIADKEELNDFKEISISSKMNIISLVFGVLSLLLYDTLPGISFVALITGFFYLKKGYKNKKTLAIVGIVLGSIYSVMTIYKISIGATFFGFLSIIFVIVAVVISTLLGLAE